MPKNCPDKVFIRIDGSNGATFFFSTRSFADWRCSLEFYRGVSFAAKVKKLILVCAYIAAKMRAAYSCADVAATIRSELNLSSTPEVAADNSAMISPTRDKAIIYRHGKGYLKFAVCNSCTDVAGEISFYQKLSQFAPKEFCVSKISAISETPNEVSFFMEQIPEKTFETVPSIAELLPLLKEFFNIERGEELAWQLVIDELANSTADGKILDKIEHCKIAGSIRRGWVHRDFKPWNLKKTSAKNFLLFDFESSVYDGLPLEDFFNYLIEPALNSFSPEAVDRQVKKNFPLAEKLLAMLDIDKDQLSNCYRYYLLNRCVYLSKNGKTSSSEKYQLLYDLYTEKR